MSDKSSSSEESDISQTLTDTNGLHQKNSIPLVLVPGLHYQQTFLNLNSKTSLSFTGKDELTVLHNIHIYIFFL
jgi:hypothetical protein